MRLCVVLILIQPFVQYRSPPRRDYYGSVFVRHSPAPPKVWDLLMEY
jgi:hypothetical protein